MVFHIWKNFSFISSYLFYLFSFVWNSNYTFIRLHIVLLFSQILIFFSFFLSSLCINLDVFFPVLPRLLLLYSSLSYLLLCPSNFSFQILSFSSKEIPFEFYIISSISFLIKTIVSFKYLNIIILTLKSSFGTSIVFSFLRLVLLIEIFSWLFLSLKCYILWMLYCWMPRFCLILLRVLKFVLTESWVFVDKVDSFDTWFLNFIRITKVAVSKTLS